MRVAIVSDIHGNRTAFEAVLSDLRDAAPDLVLHGGDLADAGSGPVEIVDRIRALGWPGVYGNTDEMLFRPQSFGDFAAGLPQFETMWRKIAEMAEWTREKLGSERLEWLSQVPSGFSEGDVGLVHASPQSAWSVLKNDDGYRELNRPLVVFGHIHRPFVKRLEGYTLANSGSVGQPYDGDPRASYLLVDNGTPTIRRVEYDIERETARLKDCGIPHAEWIATILRNAQAIP